MKYDAIIIGFGKGGKTLAARLAAAGQSVALLERSEQMYGGTCINVGCIPSKSLVNSAAVSAAHPSESFERKAARYAAAIAEKRRVTSMLRQKNFHKLDDLPGVTVITGQARFIGPGEVEVSAAEGALRLEAERIFINTGSVSVTPPIDGLQHNPTVYYSDTLMELDRLPQRLTIIGGGYVGLEFASMYAGFGSLVTVLQDGETFLPREDGDMAQAIRGLLEAQGVTIRLGVRVHRVEEDGTVRYELGAQPYAQKADAVLVATGRRPNTDGLNLSAAGVRVTPRGAVEVDELLRTSQPGIWAMGDVTGGLQFTYVSLDDSRVVASQLEQGKAYTVKDRTNMPYSVFMRTPFARVGLNEREALAAGYDIAVASMPAAAIPKAQATRRIEGLLKAVVNRADGRILGVMLLCQEAHEMINTVKLAMDMGAGYTVLRDMIFTHPTMSEALNDLFGMI